MSRCDNCGKDLATNQVVLYTIREMDRSTRYDGLDKVTTTAFGEAMPHAFQVCTRCLTRHLYDPLITLGAFIFSAIILIVVWLLHWQGVLANIVMGLSAIPFMVMLVRTVGFWKLSRLAKKQRSQLQPQATINVISAEKYAELQRGSGIL